MYDWRFRAMTRNELSADPVQAEFFTPENATDALVRESIQNSLDAKAGDGPVRVRIVHAAGDSGLDPAKAAWLFEGLEPHLKANALAIPRKERMSYLVIEDFGTRGLVGDPAQEDDEEGAAERNDFYYFWRNVGRSRKSRSELGRWGLGKTVFPASSRIFSFFAMTRRSRDSRVLLMGQSVLQIHKLQRRKFCPYGYFAKFHGQDAFQLPIESPREIKRFAGLFDLRRSNQPGLSVVIPYAWDEIEDTALVRSVLDHYFYPILRGDLEVEISRKGRRAQHLTAETIEEASAHAFPEVSERERLHAMLDLARWGIKRRPREFVPCEIRPENGAPKWSDDALGDEVIRELATRYDQGDRIAIRVQTDVVRKGGGPESAHFDVFIERVETGARAEEQFIRNSITISGAGGRGGQGYRGIVVVEHPALARLLGDSENPSHTQWEERSRTVKEAYRQGASRIRLVRQSLTKIVRFLSRPTQDVDKSLLRDLFYADLDPVRVERRSGDQKGTGPTAKGDTPSFHPSHPIYAERTTAGFRVTANSDSAVDGKLVEIEVAYDLRRGNPFAAYSSADFELGKEPIRIQARACRIVRAAENRVLIRPESPDYEVVVEGFDTRRDLRINAKTVESEP